MVDLSGVLADGIRAGPVLLGLASGAVGAEPRVAEAARAMHAYQGLVAAEPKR